MDCEAVFGTGTPVIGMAHVPPLPGAPGFDGDRADVWSQVKRDVQALTAGGIDGVLVENFGDAPFYPTDVPKHVVADLTAIADRITAMVEVPVGVNVLRNDATAAVGIAGAVGGSFIRVNVHTGARVTDQGIIEGGAHETIRYREDVAPAVQVLADIDVKHSTPLGGEERHLDPVAETVERGLADGVIVSGPRTGEPTDADDVVDVQETLDAMGVDVPVFVGSGVTIESVGSLLDVADGVIVGTALKADGETMNPVDEMRVERLVQAAQSG